jgi:hypothetical protein
MILLKYLNVGTAHAHWMEGEADVEMGDALSGEQTQLQHVRLARLTAIRLQMPTLSVPFVAQVMLRVFAEALMLLHLKYTILFIKFIFHGNDYICKKLPLLKSLPTRQHCVSIGPKENQRKSLSQFQKLIATNWENQ